MYIYIHIYIIYYLIKIEKLTNHRHKVLPGHGILLQVSPCVSIPWQSFPPLLASVILIRVFIFFPPPQVLEQVVQFPKLPHLQSTLTSKISKLLRSGFFAIILSKIGTHFYPKDTDITWACIYVTWFYFYVVSHTFISPESCFDLSGSCVYCFSSSAGF